MHDPTDPNDPPPDLARLALWLLAAVALGMIAFVLIVAL